MSVAKLKSLFYAYAFFNAFILIYPLYTVMFADKGLDASQISVLLIAWSVTSFLLEVPSGAIADKFPRKYVLIVAGLFQAVSFGCWLVWPSFWGFMAGFLLWGIKSALTSGTEEAIMYDELKRVGAEKQYAKVTGRTETLDLMGLIAAGLAASLIAHLGYAPLLCLSIGGVLISMVALLLLPRVKSVETTEETRYWEYLTDGVRMATRNRKVLFLLIFMGIVTGLGAVDEYYNLLFKEQGMTNGQVALWMGVIFIFGAIGSLFAHRLESKRLPLTTGIILWAALLLVAALLPVPFSPVAIGLYVCLFYVIKVLFNTYLQQELNDKNRATATSVGGLLSEVGALVSYVTFALIAGGMAIRLPFRWYQS